MTTTFTGNKGFPLQGTGDNPNTWGSTLNTSLFTPLDLNIGGQLSLSVAGNSNVTLTATQAQNGAYIFTGVLTGSISVIWPNTQANGPFVVNNQTTGAFTLTVKPSGGTGFTVPQNSITTAWNNGSTFTASAPNVTNAGTIAPQALAGSMRNGVIKQASNTTITVTADEVIVKSALGGLTFVGASASHTLNAATTGANGLDTGSLANNTYYALYEIYNPATNTFACMGCTFAVSSATIYAGSNLPSGYTASGLISVFRTDGSAHIKAYNQFDRDIWFPVVNIFTATSGVTTLTSQSLSLASDGTTLVVPTIAKTVSGYLLSVAAGALGTPEAASDSSGTGDQFSGGTTTAGVGNYQPALNFSRVPLVTAQTLYWNIGSNANNWKLTISGFSI